MDKVQLNPEELNNILQNCPEDEKGNKIVPDAFFDQYYKQLPNGTKNASGGAMVYNGGRLRMLGADPERDREIQKLGGEALQATQKQRRTMAEDIANMLNKYDKNLEMTEQEKGLAAMLREWQDGNVKAGQFLRDTVGEQPVSKQEITGELMTDADKQVIKNALNRLKNNDQNSGGTGC